MLDLIVKNGLLFDGTGNPARKTDVGIKNGRIVRIFPNIRENADEVLDAEGLWVLPGFVESRMTRAAPPEAWERAKQDSALGTIYDAQVTASFAAWLLSDLCHGVTGQVFNLDSRIY